MIAGIDQHSAPRSLSEFQKAATFHALRECELFSGLPADTLREVLKYCHVRALARGEYLFHENLLSHGLYIVQQGAIKVQRVDLHGKEQVMHVFRPYEVLGADALFSPSGHHADATATERSRIVVLQKLDFIPLLKRHPDLVIALLRSLGEEIRLLMNLVEDLTLKDVETRLANWLIQHCPNPKSSEPCTIELAMTKNLLASELGTVSETFSRALAKFKQQKLVLIHGRAVTLLCPIKLARLVRSESEEDSLQTNLYSSPHDELFLEGTLEMRPHT
jgi:CRP-like cAMP-binding protein